MAGPTVKTELEGAVRKGPGPMQSPSMASLLSVDTAFGELPEALNAPRDTAEPSQDALRVRKRLSEFAPASGPLRAEPPQEMCVPERRIYQYDTDLKAQLSNAAKRRIKDMKLRAETCRRADLTPAEANCYFAIGVFYDNAAMLRRACRYYKKYLVLVSRENEEESRVRRAIGFNALGVNYQLLEEGWEAHAAFCHRMHVKLSMAPGRFIAHTNLALLDLRAGNTKSAAENAQASLKHSITASSVEAQAIAVAHIAACSSIEGDHATAEACTSRYLELTKALRDRIGQARGLLNMGVALARDSSRLDEAVAYFKQAVEKAKTIGDKTLEAKATMAQGIAKGRAAFERQMSGIDLSAALTFES